MFIKKVKDIKMNIHIVSDFEGIVIGAYTDINLVYEAIRYYLRYYHLRKYSEYEIEKFNEDLLRDSIKAMNDRGFYVKTLNVDSGFEWN